ncbi:MAG: hypothetical protein C5B52_06220 [Bacteroidetes bacterium]|nr:MAG: hypothetical protein C5B52_06220 [Bacteroidota bacterium]
MKRGFWIRKAVMIVFFAALFITVFSYVVMLLWNAILPQVLHVSSINFIQALGILVLSKILFGGFHGGWRGRGGHWKYKMREKWQNMSVEDREKFKQEWRARCRGWRMPDEREKPAADKESPGRL